MYQLKMFSLKAFSKKINKMDTFFFTWMGVDFEGLICLNGFY